SVIIQRIFPLPTLLYFPTRRSSDLYKGQAPEDQEESKALAELTRQEKFQRTVSYHSSGEVIYWDFGQKGEFRKICRNFGERIQRSEEHTSELQSRFDLVCRLLLEKK